MKSSRRSRSFDQTIQSPQSEERICVGKECSVASILSGPFFGTSCHQTLNELQKVTICLWRSKKHFVQKGHANPWGSKLTPLSFHKTSMILERAGFPSVKTRHFTSLKSVSMPKAKKTYSFSLILIFLLASRCFGDSARHFVWKNLLDGKGFVGFALLRRVRVGHALRDPQAEAYGLPWRHVSRAKGGPMWLSRFSIRGWKRLHIEKD